MRGSIRLPTAPPHSHTPHPAPHTVHPLFSYDSACVVAHRQTGNRASSRASSWPAASVRPFFHDLWYAPHCTQRSHWSFTARLAVSDPLSTSLLNPFCSCTTVFVFVCPLCARSCGLDVKPTQASCVDAWQHSLGSQHKQRQRFISTVALYLDSYITQWELGGMVALLCAVLPHSSDLGSGTRAPHQPCGED